MQNAFTSPCSQFPKVTYAPLPKASLDSLSLTYGNYRRTIPDYLTLVSIQTIDNQDAGVHILTFTINDPEHFDDDDTAGITCLECLRDTFAYDPEACFGQAPKVNEFENLYTVTVPFTC